MNGREALVLHFKCCSGPRGPQRGLRSGGGQGGIDCLVATTFGLLTTETVGTWHVIWPGTPTTACIKCKGNEDEGYL